MAADNHNSDRSSNGASSLRDMVLAKKAELEAQLKALDTLDIERLLAEREQTAARLDDLDAKIAQVRVQLGLDASNAGKPPASRATDGVRTRMNSQEVRGRIAKALGEERSGLSQLQIAERTAIAYGTVAAYLKANASAFKTTGQLKGKRYFLK